MLQTRPGWILFLLFSGVQGVSYRDEDYRKCRVQGFGIRMTSKALTLFKDLKSYSDPSHNSGWSQGTS